MTAPEPSGDLALLRAAQDRRLETEGIPMVLALVSEIGEMPTVAGAVQQQGTELAGRMDGYRQALFPSSRDDDMGAVITVLQVTSYADFGRDGAR